MAPEGTRAGNATYLHKDHLGTPRLLTDDDGDTVGRHDYYPFGTEIARGGQADEPTKKYTGHERDNNGRADYMLGRTYLYPFMRFATPDPARDGWSLYAYTGNNPVNYVDPDGLAVRALDAGAFRMIQETVPENLRSFVTVRYQFQFLLLKLIHSHQMAQITSPELFLGVFSPPGKEAPGISQVITSDGTGRASTVPRSELVKTMAHELYGHALLFCRGGDWGHDNGGPVDKHIKAIETRTEKLYE